MFDVWEFPEKCVGCGCACNGDTKQPLSYLDATSKLCELCWIEKEELLEEVK